MPVCRPCIASFVSRRRGGESFFHQCQEARLTPPLSRSYGELDILFENKVPAWRFKSTKVDRECRYSRPTVRSDANVATEFSAVHDIQKVEALEDKRVEPAQISHLDH